MFSFHEQMHLLQCPKNLMNIGSGVRLNSHSALDWIRNRWTASCFFKGQSCCVRNRAGRPARPRTQHDYHHDTKVKPEAATAVIELLMMGGKTPETCWAVNKRQKINWKIVASGWWFVWTKIYIKKRWDFIYWIHLAQETDFRPAVVNGVKRHWFLWKAGHS